MKVAITGGIGSGKSYVCDLLAQRGIDIYNCDNEAKRLMASSNSIHNKLVCAVGEEVYCDNKLNKPILAAFLLRSADNAAVINGIVHPEVANDFLQSGKQWMECAILYESGFDRFVDVVVAVTAPVEVRIGRIMQRDNISCDKAREWISRQMPQEEVSSRANYEIINDGQHDVARQIEDIINNITKQKCYRPS